MNFKCTVTFLTVILFASVNPTIACELGTYRAWHNDCKRISAATDVLVEPSSVPTKLLLLYDGQVVRLTAAIPLSYYQRFRTGTPATIVVFGSSSFVADLDFFNERFPAILRIGSQQFMLEWDGAPHWRLRQQLTDAAIEAFRNGTTIELEYAHLILGKGQRREISLMGFSAALNAFGVRKAVEFRVQPSPSAANSIVARHIGPNQFEINMRDLVAKANPHGRGYFVFIPKKEYFGFERLFVWFVNAGVASSLNGATVQLTPNLSVPRLAQRAIWQDSGLTETTALDVGLTVAFGR